MDDIRKRGSNYTPSEKKTLLELIKKYQEIIENKSMNTTINKKKEEAWEIVCRQYNASQVSGLRTWKQLRHLYENMKQRCQVDVNEIKTKSEDDPDEVKDASEDSKSSIIMSCSDEEEIEIPTFEEQNPLSPTFSSNGHANERKWTKEAYYKAKLVNARMERRFLINKNNMEINKYKMEMKILSYKLLRLKSTTNIR